LWTIFYKLNFTNHLSPLLDWVVACPVSRSCLQFPVVLFVYLPAPQCSWLPAGILASGRSCSACLSLGKVANSCVSLARVWWTNSAQLCKWWNPFPSTTGPLPQRTVHKLRHLPLSLIFRTIEGLTLLRAKFAHDRAGCTHLKKENNCRKTIAIFRRRGKDNTQKQIIAGESGVESKEQTAANRKTETETRHQCRIRTRPCRTTLQTHTPPPPLLPLPYSLLDIYFCGCLLCRCLCGSAHICTCFAFVFHALLSWKLMHITYSIELHISPDSVGNGS